jgi:hypothetical protein
MVKSVKVVRMSTAPALGPSLPVSASRPLTISKDPNRRNVGAMRVITAHRSMTTWPDGRGRRNTLFVNAATPLRHNGNVRPASVHIAANTHRCSTCPEPLWSLRTPVFLPGWWAPPGLAWPRWQGTRAGWTAAPMGSAFGEWGKRVGAGNQASRSNQHPAVGSNKHQGGYQ